MTLQTNTNRRTQTRIANYKSKTKNTTTSNITITYKKTHTRKYTQKTTKLKPKTARHEIERLYNRLCNTFLANKHPRIGKTNHTHRQTNSNVARIKHNKQKHNATTNNSNTRRIIRRASSDSCQLRSNRPPTQHPNTQHNILQYKKKNTRIT